MTFFFFFEREEGVWVTALGGLALHVCTSFITNRHNMVRTQIYPDKAQRSVYIVCSDIKGKEMKTAMSLVSWFPGCGAADFKKKKRKKEKHI